MLEQLLELDRKILLVINGRTLPSDLDYAMITLTTLNNAKYFFWFLIPVVLFFFIKHFEKKALFVIPITGLLAAAADQFNYRIIKELTFRLRPYAAMEDVILRVPYGPKSSSFPSNHATTTMALAIWLSYLFPRATPIWVSISLIIGFSRVYVGVHYPSDVIAAWIIGALMGWLFVKASEGFLKLRDKPLV